MQQSADTWDVGKDNLSLNFLLKEVLSEKFSFNVISSCKDTAVCHLHEALTNQRKILLFFLFNM